MTSHSNDHANLFIYKSRLKAAFIFLEEKLDALRKFFYLF
jgi:hypothetical protein